MTADKEGFLYPIVDEEKCLHCGKCDAVCPVEKYSWADKTVPDAWGANANNSEIRLASSSGGVFSLLSKMTIDNNGVVCGATLNPNCKSVSHVVVDSEEQLAELRGSKYLQSEVGDTYKQIRKLLAEGRNVLYTGTPCQIAGLKSFLGKEYDKLLCVGIFCHGVPSPKLWAEYVEYCEEQNGEPLKAARFRDKKKGWENFGMMMEFPSGNKQFKTAEKDPYIRMFLRNYCLRPSCYQCEFKENKCGADIMIGDFWGVQVVAEEMYDDMGTSLVFAYTEKGKKAIEIIRSEMKLCEVSYEKAVKGNNAFVGSVSMPEARKSFFEDMAELDFKSLAEKYVPITAKEQVKWMLKRLHLLDIACKILGK